MSITRVLCSSAIASALLTSPALANLLSYSGLQGAANGSINDVADGFGWNSDGWDTQGAGNPYLVANATPLSYSNLLTSPGGEYISGGNAFTSLGRKLDVNPGGVYDAAGFISNAFVNGDIDRGLLWFSILMRPATNVASQEIRFTGDNNIAWKPLDNGDLVLENNGANWGIGIQGGTFTNSGKAVLVNQSNLLVTRIDLNGLSSSVHLWVNPAALNTADPSLASADAAVTGLNASAIEFRHIGLFLGSGAGNGAADELRVGTTYADVTPTNIIPEPTTALLSLVALTLSTRLRRW